MTPTSKKHACPLCLHRHRAPHEEAAYLRARFTCAVCGQAHNGGSFMLQDSVWHEAGLGSKDVAHILCVEMRLRRSLVRADFKNVPINDVILWALNQPR